jgi:hypothetical protein
MLAAVVLGWPLTRALLRRLRHHGATTQDRFRASLAAVRADLGDFGIRVAPSDTLRDIADVVRTFVGSDVDEFVERSEAIMYGGREATEDDVRNARALSRELRRRLRARRGWLQTVFATYRLQA